MTIQSTCAVGLTLALTAVGCSVPPPDAPLSTVVAYEGATLITGDGGPPLGGGVLVVDQGVITDVGLAANVTIPEGATVVDLSGKTVMPALVDLHGHVGYQRGLGYDEANYTRENLIDHLNRYAYYGVGTIVSMGTDPGDLAFQIQAEQQAGYPGRRAAAHGVSRLCPAECRTRRRGAPSVGVWCLDRGRGARARGGTGGDAGRLRQDLGRRSGRPGRETDAGPVSADHRGGARARPAGDRARLLPGGRPRAGRGGCRRLRPPGA